MVGGKEHFAILDALKRVLWHFLQHALHFARMVLLKEKRKMEKGTFNPNVKLCNVQCALSNLVPAAQHNISSAGKVIGASMYVFLSLHLFAKILLQMTHACANSQFSLKFSYFMK